MKRASLAAAATAGAAILFLFPVSAGATGEMCCRYWEYQPGRFTNTAAGDVIVQSSPGLLQSILAPLGEPDTHVFTIYDNGGQRISQAHVRPDLLDDGNCSTPADPNSLRNLPPGVRNNVLADGDFGLDVLRPRGTVLEGAGRPFCWGAGEWYHIHAFAENLYNGQCANFARDSCNVPVNPRFYDPGLIYNAAGVTYNAVFDTCYAQISWPWYLHLFCGYTRFGACERIANQVINQILWNRGEWTTDWRFVWGAFGGRSINGPASPSTIRWSWGGGQHNAEIQTGYWTCLYEEKCGPILP